MPIVRGLTASNLAAMSSVPEDDTEDKASSVGAQSSGSNASACASSRFRSHRETSDPGFRGDRDLDATSEYTSASARQSYGSRKFSQELGSIRMRREVCTNYDAYFARRTMDLARNTLDRQTLRRDVREVNRKLRRLNWMLLKPNSHLQRSQRLIS